MDVFLEIDCVQARLKVLERDGTGSSVRVVILTSSSIFLNM